MRFMLKSLCLPPLLAATALAGAGLAQAEPAAQLQAQAAAPSAVKADAAPQTARGAERTETHGAVTFRIRPYAETWRGLPGYAAGADFLNVESTAFPQAHEIADYINGQATEGLFYTRMEAQAQQGSDACSYAVHDSANPCQYETDMKAAEFQNTGGTVSVRYISGDFPIGAAHPNHSQISYNFSLRPMFRIVSLSEMFTEPDKAFPNLQAQIRASLMSSLGENGAPPPDKEAVWQGTEGWGALAAFTLAKDGIAVYFSPYAVAPYSFGDQRAFVPYAAVKKDLKPFYREELGLDK